MKTKTLIRTLMAVAMLFAVQTSANAQLGGLKKLAKKAVDKATKDPLGGTDNTTVVTTTTTTTTSISGSEDTATQPADPMAEYVQDIVKKNYLLDDLSDKNRNAKAVADYKSKVNAKVKADLAPAKILGTYSTSAAWQGLPIFQMPELNEKYNSVQEMQFKTFYEKDGKYYVLKSAFRQSIPKGDNVHGAQPQPDYWPGLETPVEIPADKIQGKF